MVTSLRPVGACVPLAGVAAAAEVEGDDPDEEVDDEVASEMLPINVLTFTWQCGVDKNRSTGDHVLLEWMSTSSCGGQSERER